MNLQFWVDGSDKLCPALAGLRRVSSAGFVSSSLLPVHIIVFV
jgi:hypothetical protein